jgi:peptidoglycan/LPS O-acetylase OafA/YrhL
VSLGFAATTSGVTFITYLWHYLVARLIYEQMLRPVIHGHPWSALLVCCVAIVGFAVGRWSGRRRSPRAGKPSRRRTA